MAMSTTIISQTTTMSDAFVEESGHKDIFSFKSIPDSFSQRQVYDAYMSCRRRKRNTINALKFEVNLLENLYSL